MKTRYYEHWGAKTPVFVRERPPGQIFWHPGVTKVFEELLQWTSVPGRIISLVGGVGLGKTTLLREIYHQYPKGWDASVFVVTGWETDPLWLLGGIANFFGDQSSWENPDLQLKIVQKGVEQLQQEGRHLLLLIDGVERLQRVDDLAVLKDLQELCGDCISVLLVGQKTYYKDCDHQAVLEPWTFDAVKNAVNWCLEQADLQDFPVHDHMLQELFTRSYGVPSALMRLAEGALVTGAMCQAKVWSPELIPVDHVGQEAIEPKQRRTRKSVAKAFEKKSPSGRG